MSLSDLQRYILITTYKNGPQTARSVFQKFYSRSASGAAHATQNTEQEIKVITVSIERLITKGLIKGFGYKTAEKLFIQKVSLTPRGNKEVLKLLEDAQRLPFARSQKRKR